VISIGGAGLPGALSVSPVRALHHLSGPATIAIQVCKSLKKPLRFNGALLAGL
jgi:hypothetical protein